MNPRTTLVQSTAAVMRAGIGLTLRYRLISDARPPFIAVLMAALGQPRQDRLSSFVSHNKSPYFTKVPSIPYFVNIILIVPSFLSFASDVSTVLRSASPLRVAMPR
jgi:hypothetical protein